jgi:radical SAM superfamily enzyme YgiQ (UPF0313 family)
MSRTAPRQAVDVLFINPGDRRRTYQDLGDEFCAIEPPILAGLYATHARSRGHVPAIFDAPAMQASAEETARVATQEHAARLVVLVVYGLQPSASTQNMGAAGRIARAIRRLAPETPIMMVGTHPAALPERTMREEAIDFVCDLEGPRAIDRVLDQLKTGGRGFADIPSLWWRDGERIVAPTAREALITDLDGELPGIAWDLLPMDRYRAHNWHCFDNLDDRGGYASIHASLGCPFACGFCCINAPFGKPSYRMWSPDRVVAEIDHLVAVHGVRNLKIADEMFVLNRDHVEAICARLAARPYRVNIWAYARVDTIHDDMLPLLKRAGVNWLALGIESASAEVRDGARKRYRDADIEGVVRRVQAAGIRVIGNYIFGLPDDTMERMGETLALALRAGCDFSNFYSAMAYPGSPLYRLAVERGLPLPATWDDFSQHGLDCLPLANGQLSARDILAFRDRAFAVAFRHPPYLDMIRAKFGERVVEHIARMTALPLPRRLAA